MVQLITIATYYESFSQLPLIDVRSPGEYAKGHVPGATNIPLFSNEERAAVGTCYVQESREQAIALGYTYVNPKLNAFITDSRKVAGDGPVVVHCWRGGMRSKSFAEHLAANGFQEVYLIEGGYKAFRRHVLAYFEQPLPLKVLGGYTGSGKTKVLQVLQEKGEQVVDLEAIAHHKGSAFGSIGEQAQPTVEHFENKLFEAFHALHPVKDIWVEDESMNIGHAKMPKSLYLQIRSAVLYFMDVPLDGRLQLLVGDYAQYGNAVLEEALLKIKKRLGGKNLQDALHYLKEDNYAEVARIALQYYDKAYKTGMGARKAEKVVRIAVPGADAEENARIILEKTR